ncbi:Protein CBG26783 [Caenorhabditis briggsae]|uniref:Protein CBG26783 n=1 Tax=Caenorhabditis briggsae TaxID=6238 RepID=B6IH95_CAEBR|nr:Protein CBG26783 [Caenorhabditis briggsae]CAR99275.1 Protein CBG26783 [Caenorhabditis briggsae]
MESHLPKDELIADPQSREITPEEDEYEPYFPSDEFHLPAGLDWSLTQDQIASRLAEKMPRLNDAERKYAQLTLDAITTKQKEYQAKGWSIYRFDTGFETQEWKQPELGNITTPNPAVYDVPNLDDLYPKDVPPEWR